AEVVLVEHLGERLWRYGVVHADTRTRRRPLSDLAEVSAGHFDEVEVERESLTESLRRVDQLEDVALAICGSAVHETYPFLIDSRCRQLTQVGRIPHDVRCDSVALRVKAGEAGADTRHGGG